MNSSTEILTFLFVTDLIFFMINEAEKLMKGSVHEDDFFVVHDALLSLTPKHCGRKKNRPHAMTPSSDSLLH